jgi:VanZ family protein
MKKNTLLYVTVIALLITLIPLPYKAIELANVWDKLIHFFIFSVLGFIAQNVLALFSLLYGLFLATVTELCQKFIPTRNPDLIDWAVNFLGIVIGSSFWELVRK